MQRRTFEVRADGVPIGTRFAFNTAVDLARDHIRRTVAEPGERWQLAAIPVRVKDAGNTVRARQVWSCGPRSVTFDIEADPGRLEV